MENANPVDAVIAWVDGNDPAHRARRRQFARPEELSNDSIAGDTRYTSIGEINYCVASILRFAPWIRNIFIVTDKQDPKLEEYVEKHFPGRSRDLHIVDHSVVFRGMEEALPVFNSLSIESVLWRIPGLAERYIYFNDDFSLSAPVTPEDFYADNGLVCYGSRLSLKLVKLLRELKHLRPGPKVFGFKDALAESADAINRYEEGGKKKFNHIVLCGHTPHPQLRSLLEGFFTDHPDALKSNAFHRFREPSQFNPQELCYLLAEARGMLSLRPLKGEALYLKPKNKEGYVAGKIAGFESNPKARFCCLNSIDCASKEDQELIISWLKRRIGLQD